MEHLPDPPDDLDGVVRGLTAQLRRMKDRRIAWMPVPPAPAAAPDPAPSPRAAAPAGTRPTLPQIRAELGDCQRCKLARTRTNLVFGVGNPDAELVFVGEAPGQQEDLQGEPFVGDAGQLLTKMINAMGYQREDVYILNTLKCRPPGNRNPEADETAACEPFLKQQLAALQPRVIVALGKFAAAFLAGKPDAAIGSLRGRFHTYEGIKVMPTYHPAYLLRTPSAKRIVWEDLQLVMAELGKK